VQADPIMDAVLADPVPDAVLDDAVQADSVLDAVLDVAVQADPILDAFLDVAVQSDPVLDVVVQTEAKPAVEVQTEEVLDVVLQIEEPVCAEEVHSPREALGRAVERPSESDAKRTECNYWCRINTSRTKTNDEEMQGPPKRQW
jgi:hypothetical protein